MLQMKQHRLSGEYNLSQPSIYVCLGKNLYFCNHDRCDNRTDVMSVMTDMGVSNQILTMTIVKTFQYPIVLICLTCSILY